MQGTPVQSLVQEEPTFLGATKLVGHNYWGCAPGPGTRKYWARMPGNPHTYGLCSAAGEATTGKAQAKAHVEQQRLTAAKSK